MFQAIAKIEECMSADVLERFSRSDPDGCTVSNRTGVPCYLHQTLMQSRVDSDCGP